MLQALRHHLHVRLHKQRSYPARRGPGVRGARYCAADGNLRRGDGEAFEELVRMGVLASLSFSLVAFLGWCIRTGVVMKRLLSKLKSWAGPPHTRIHLRETTCELGMMNQNEKAQRRGVRSAELIIAGPKLHIAGFGRDISRKRCGKAGHGLAGK